MAQHLQSLLVDGRKPCKPFFSSQECSYGDKCSFSHDVAKWLQLRSQSTPKESLEMACPFFDKAGKCPYGYLCVFASSHLKDGKLVIEERGNSVQLNVDSTSFSPALRAQLRSGNYEFSVAPKLLEQYRVSRDLKNSNRCSPELDNSVFALSTNDFEYLPVSRERSLLFSDKLYLAPLTTVGNLPFRRVCKILGADITCGEMAECKSILEGRAGEWALLRRHSSEDLFGVQISGNSVEELCKSVELISTHCSVNFIDLNVGCPIDQVCKRGLGAGMLQKPNRMLECVRGMVGTSKIPITVKIRTGYSENKRLTCSLIPKLASCGISALTVHGRTREQRYTRLADYDYLGDCAIECAKQKLPFFANGDIFTMRQYFSSLDLLRSRAEDMEFHNYPSGLMIARGALIKPWIFTEIKERRDWDISSRERFELLQSFVNNGLEHWGSDDLGVEHTRRFLLEWLSFFCRYVPLGVMETLPGDQQVQMNWRPPPFVGRDDLETLMSSPLVSDWIKISEMLLGPVRKNFEFVPKHKANAYSSADQDTQG
eukprot:TRINITY_DN4952_c0_g1_i5.p1 TRINITY_DN4952_c0_g1~~TRINITY_DN4952_c0_g1_i5.p1  ORF type:complete len:542 (+),score=99.16 TRINITY_DN4952_c0_g1_i5:252-1877(+)